MSSTSSVSLYGPQMLFAEPDWRPCPIRPASRVKYTRPKPALRPLIVASTLEKFRYTPDKYTEFKHTDFKPFRRLPLELRLAVFALALPTPSLVEVGHILYSKNNAGRRGIGFIVQYHSIFSASNLRAIRNMGMLSANSESRSVYIKGMPIVIPMVHPGRQRGVNKLYLSADDLLYIASLDNGIYFPHTLEALRHEVWVKQLEQIAFHRLNCVAYKHVGLTSWRHYFAGPSWVDVMKIFENVKEVKLVWDISSVLYQGLKYEQFDQGPPNAQRSPEELAEWYGPESRPQKMLDDLLLDDAVVEEGLMVPKFSML